MKWNSGTLYHSKTHLWEINTIRSIALLLFSFHFLFQLTLSSFSMIYAAYVYPRKVQHILGFQTGFLLWKTKKLIHDHALEIILDITRTFWALCLHKKNKQPTKILMIITRAFMTLKSFENPFIMLLRSNYYYFKFIWLCMQHLETLPQLIALRRLFNHSLHVVVICDSCSEKKWVIVEHLTTQINVVTPTHRRLRDRTHLPRKPSLNRSLKIRDILQNIYLSWSEVFLTAHPTQYV